METDVRPLVYVPDGSPVSVPDDIALDEHLGFYLLSTRGDRTKNKVRGRQRKAKRNKQQQCNVQVGTLPDRVAKGPEAKQPSAAKEPDPTDPMTVPPELAARAESAALLWDMTVYDMTVAATKPEKGGAIWRIQTSAGVRSLKLLHRPPARSLFSVAAQDYLVRQGARVPPLVRSRKGELCEVVDGQVWIVTDWVESLTPATKVDLEGARALCYGLGEFHRHTRGYEPPSRAQYATRLRKWPKTYAKMRTKINWFEALARVYPDMPASNTLLNVVGHFGAQADDAIARLERSQYAHLIERGEPEWGLAHQDFGWSNGQLGPGGLWIIDLDGVAYDLPIRDLRKLITSTMDDRGDWDLTWMQGMIQAYTDANPIEAELMEVMLIDILLPNEFYKLVKEILFDPTMLNQEMGLMLQRLMEAEERKSNALVALGLGGR